MLFANALVFHTGVNKNKSNVTKDAAEKAIKNLAYKPVLANFCEIDGVRDFTSHDFEIDENGNYVYFEKQVGCFTADKASIEQDPDSEDRMNVFAKVAIPREYTDAAEIIERKNGTDVSVELAVNSMSYNAKDKVLMLEDIDVMGLTLLGVDPDTGDKVGPGMAGAHIQIEDFSAENNSLSFNAQLVNSIADAVAERLSNKAAHVANNQGKEEEKPVEFEEKIEEVTEEINSEVMEETAEEETTVVETEASKEVSDETADETPEVVEEFADDDQDETTDETTEEEVVIDDDTLTKKVTHSVAYGEVTKEFSVSLQDKIYALSTLVNDTYSESDNTWYEVTVYDDEKYVVMKDWWNDKAFKQSYKVKKDVYSLVGDRVAVYAQYLTEDEIKKLDDMRANYSSISDKLAKYEAEPQKMEILNSEDYANIADTEAFAELKKEENHFDMSVDELKSECDRQLLAYAKNNKIEYSEQIDKKSVGMKQFGRKDTKKSGRYGNLFKK